MDVLCQAKSGMGKTAVFVLATLQQLEPVDGQVSNHSQFLNHTQYLYIIYNIQYCFTLYHVMLFFQVAVLVLCHTRELAFQISKEYERFSKYLKNANVAVFFGGMPISKDEEVLKKNCPHIVVGTPGRILALVRNKSLKLKDLKTFVLDECDKMLDTIGEKMLVDIALKIFSCPIVSFSILFIRSMPITYNSGVFVISDMRSDVQEIFRATPHEKQVMMFSATLSKDIRVVCKKFMQDVIIVGALWFTLLCVLLIDHLAWSAISTTCIRYPQQFPYQVY